MSAQTTPLFLPLSKDQFSRGKNNGTNTIILFNKGVSLFVLLAAVCNCSLKIVKRLLASISTVMLPLVDDHNDDYN